MGIADQVKGRHIRGVHELSVILVLLREAVSLDGLLRRADSFLVGSASGGMCSVKQGLNVVLVVVDVLHQLVTGDLRALASLTKDL